METASERITHKLGVGTLPADDPVKTWGGFGSGLGCDGCGLVISSKESVHEHQMQNGSVLHFHVACADLWRILKQALPLDRKHAPPPSSSL
jgi:hypothetical protein